MKSVTIQLLRSIENRRRRVHLLGPFTYYEKPLVGTVESRAWEPGQSLTDRNGFRYFVGPDGSLRRSVFKTPFRVRRAAKRERAARVEATWFEGGL